VAGRALLAVHAVEKTKYLQCAKTEGTVQIDTLQFWLPRFDMAEDEARYERLVISDPGAERYDIKVRDYEEDMLNRLGT
jgi:hypothetical protein